ncbi:hypothetical protein L8W60_05620 [Campylobacter lari]|nr:hypothetical protein [Campylobacter lari]
MRNTPKDIVGSGSGVAGKHKRQQMQQSIKQVLLLKKEMKKLKKYNVLEYLYGYSNIYCHRNEHFVVDKNKLD